ncbi:C-C motif chemokine 25b [Hoplias malabaricus]|uniref:C-C motif chemokine 25b n=1 Tax=Hoplias malabaricus TaxID=27720 RepID=UPI0034625EBB
MKIRALFFVLLLACMYPCLAQGTFENCCLKLSPGIKKNIKKRIAHYRIQETDGGCNVRAIVFITMFKREICGDPSQPWVQELMKKVDIRRAKV